MIKTVQVTRSRRWQIEAKGAKEGGTIGANHGPGVLITHEAALDAAGYKSTYTHWVSAQALGRLLDALEETEKELIERGWIRDYADDGSRIHEPEAAPAEKPSAEIHDLEVKLLEVQEKLIASNRKRLGMNP